MEVDTVALGRITESMAGCIPTDIQAGIDIVFVAIDDDPEAFDPLPLDPTVDEECEAFIEELMDIARMLRDMLYERRGEMHRRDREPRLRTCPQPCRACLREADERAGLAPAVDPVLA